MQIELQKSEKREKWGKLEKNMWELREIGELITKKEYNWGKQGKYESYEG